jgi:putative transcriptional regulator
MLDIKQIPKEEFPCLAGQFLVAMPGMHDLSFEKSVIYICAHSAEGAMGLIVNRAINSVTFSDMLEQLEIDEPISSPPIKIHFGGPVESERGFVLHTNDYLQDTTLAIDQDLSLTATLDVLKAIAIGSGPLQSLLALGYSGWGPGQLDEEMKSNGWLSVVANKDLVFDQDLGSKWDRAMDTIGINPHMLSKNVGHA